MGITEVIWAAGALVAIYALARLTNLRRSQLIDELRDYVQRQTAPAPKESETNENPE